MIFEVYKINEKLYRGQNYVQLHRSVRPMNSRDDSSSLFFKAFWKWRIIIITSVLPSTPTKKTIILSLKDAALATVRERWRKWNNSRILYWVRQHLHTLYHLHKPQLTFKPSSKKSYSKNDKDGRDIYQPLYNSMTSLPRKTKLCWIPKKEEMNLQSPIVFWWIFYGFGTSKKSVNQTLIVCAVRANQISIPARKLERRTSILSIVLLGRR